MTDARAPQGRSVDDDDARGARVPGPATRMECKVCWYVYDPTIGDEVWQVPAGTPWQDLPAHWSCPICSTTSDGFLVVCGN